MRMQYCDDGMHFIIARLTEYICIIKKNSEINKLIKMHLQMRNLCLIKNFIWFVVLMDTKDITREVIAVGLQ